MRDRLLIQRGPGERTYAIQRQNPWAREIFTTAGVNGKTADDTAIGNLLDWSEHNEGEWTVEVWPSAPWSNGARTLARARGGVGEAV